MSYISHTIKLETKLKWGAYASLRFKINLSFKFVNDLLSYDEAQTDTFGVHLLRVLNKPKQFKQLALILNVYSDASVFYFDLQIVVFNFDINENVTRSRKFDGITLQS